MRRRACSFRGTRIAEAAEIARGVAEAVSVGDPDDKRAIGPVASKAQFDKVQGLIQKGIDEGATVAVGGPGRPDGLDTGYYIKPTVFSDVNNDMTIAREEIFGPVLCILPYDDLDQAVDIANDTEYGLAGYVSAADLDAARALARRIRAGQVAINHAFDLNTAVRRLQAQRQRPRVGRVRVPRIPGDQERTGLRTLDVLAGRRLRATSLRGAVHRVDDALVAGAPAEVAGQALADLLVGGLRVVAQQRRDRHDETRCAEAALQAVALAKRGLHRRQLAVGSLRCLRPW